MRDQDLRILLEHRRDRDSRNILLDRIEGLQRVRTQVKIDLSYWQEDAIIHLRAARDDGGVEPVSAVRAVGQSLVESAVFGLRDPVGGKRQLVERLPQGGIAGRYVADRRAGDYETCTGDKSDGSPEGWPPDDVSRKSRVLHGFILSERVRNIREP